MAIRFYVERPNREFDDVGASTIIFNAGGGLVFNDDSGRLVVAYATGQWKTVTQEDED
jgi:hypothetical protein